jgi:hypothetical protein
MAELKNTELVLHGRRRFKRGAYHQLSEAGAKRPYTETKDVKAEKGFGALYGPELPKAKSNKSRIRKEITVRSFAGPARTSAKRGAKRTTKRTSRK